jgi:hypothetical protein
MQYLFILDKRHRALLKPKHAIFRYRNNCLLRKSHKLELPMSEHITAQLETKQRRKTNYVGTHLESHMNPPCLRRRQSPPGAAATTPRVGERRTRSDAAPLRRGLTPPVPPFPSPAARFLLAADSETFGGKVIFFG